MNDTTFQVNGKIAYVPVVVNTKMTKQYNADRIRAMSDEELAEKFADGCCRDVQCEDKYQMPDGWNCYGCWLDWLKKEVEE